VFDTLIHTSLRQRPIVLTLALILVIYGVFVTRQMPVDVFPDLNKPTVTLLTEAGGMAPEEVEQQVTIPIESSLNGMPGVNRVRAVSGVGLSVINVEFEWGSDIYLNRQQINERLGLVRAQLPDGVTPQLGPISSIMGEIMLIALPADPAKAHPMQVREYADWVMRPRLLTVPGIAQVIPIGGQVRQYRVEVLPEQLHALQIERAQAAEALKDFGGNSSGGFLEANGREYLIRQIGRTSSLEDLQHVVVGNRQGQPILLMQVARVSIAPATKRGDASYQGKPAVILSVQKQPGADSVRVTQSVERALAELDASRPPGVDSPRILFRQANFIEHSVRNVEEALRDGAVLVAVVLFMFLLNVRTTLISLSAIPLSLLITALVFHYMGLSINTMTLGGLAIAIGELVDDAVVGVENVLRRLQLNQQTSTRQAATAVIAQATLEVRSAIVYATLIIVLVFIPLFMLPGIEGRLFTPLGVAYVVSILASMLVSITVTPVLSAYLLPKWVARKWAGTGEQQHDTRLVQVLKCWDAKLLNWSFARSRWLLVVAGLATVLAVASLAWLPRAFLPPFNEGTLTVSLLLNPGTALAESDRVGALAEQLIASVPEVVQVGRRTGRAEQDEHAEGVHASEIDVDLKPSERSREEIVTDLRARLSALPAVVGIGQPISHRLDHLLSGVRAQIALKIYGDDLDTLRGLAADLQDRLRGIHGLTDLQVEKQVLIPQLKIRIDYEAASRLGVAPGTLLRTLQDLIEGEHISQVVEGTRHFDLVMRLPEDRRQTDALKDVLIPTAKGTVPLSQLATIEESDGPNQISRENARRRIVVSANANGRDLSAVVADIRQAMTQQALPQGYFTDLEGQFQAQEQATQRMSWLGAGSLTLIFMVLYSRYRSAVLAAIIMVNIPLALVGSVIALWWSGQPLSIAALVGFITLTGMATRNGILKISHYINLCLHEGETFGQAMIVRGSLERLTPVLMTALVAAFALVPLLLSASAPGKEVLHPVSVVIFGGLISATLLDTLLTPVMFWMWGRKPLERLLANSQAEQAHSF